MKYDIDTALIPYLINEGEWECPEIEEDPDADAETLIHDALPGVRIRISEIDRKGGLRILFLQIYDQAVAMAKAETDNR